MGLGISFSPFGEDKGPNADPRGPQVSPQEAIRVLSLRVPRVVGVHSPIPQALLNAPGGASFGAAQVPSAAGTPRFDLEQLLEMLYGRRQQPGFVTTPPMPVRDIAGGSGGTTRVDVPPMYAPPDEVRQPIPWDPDPLPRVVVGQRPGSGDLPSGPGLPAPTTPTPTPIADLRENGFAGIADRRRV